MLTLAIGDLYIPDRVVALPPQFTKLLAPNAPHVPSNSKIAQVVCLGNITQSASTLRFLHELSPALHVVRGEFDDESILSQQLQQLGKVSKNEGKSGKSEKTGKIGQSGQSEKGQSGQTDRNEGVPLYRVVNADNFRIGFTSGHQLVPQNDPLLLLAFAREIDVDVLVWGGTHRVEAYTLDGKFFINPGSATGAFSMAWPEDDDEESEHESDEGSDHEADQAIDAVESRTEELEEEKAEKAGKAGKDGKDENGGGDLENEGGDLENEGGNFENEGGDLENGKKREDGENGGVDADKGKEGPNTAFDSTLLSSSIPSFCLLDTNSSKCTLYIYTYVGGEVKVDKVIYSKE